VPMEVTKQKQQHEQPAVQAPRHWMIALAGMLLVVLAIVIYAYWSGYTLAVFYPVLVIPVLAVVHSFIAMAGRRWGWASRWIPVSVWLIPSLYFIGAGYYESRPKHIFLRHLVSPIPESVSQIRGRRMVGIEGWIDFYFNCDSNAIATIVTARHLMMDTNYVYRPPAANVNTADLEETANGLIAYKAKRLGLPTNYFKEPMLFESDRSTRNRAWIQLWVERDQRRAYFFLE